VYIKLRTADMATVPDPETDPDFSFSIVIQAITKATIKYS